MSDIQDGNTCLFECMHYVDPSYTVDEYIQMLAPDQDVVNDGYSGSAQDIINFVHTHFDAEYGPWLYMLKAGFVILTTVPEGEYNHAIVLTAVVDKTLELSDAKLYFYDPAFGKIGKMGYLDFVNTQPRYAIAIKQPQ